MTNNMNPEDLLKTFPAVEAMVSETSCNGKKEYCLIGVKDGKYYGKLDDISLQKKVNTVVTLYPSYNKSTNTIDYVLLV